MKGAHAMGSSDPIAEWDDELTPVCNLIGCMKEHWAEKSAAHARLMLSLRVPYHTPTRFAKAATSSRLLREVQAGLRKLIWSPCGVDLFSHLYPYFVRRGMDYKAHGSMYDFLRGSKTTKEAWIILSSRTFKNEDEHRQIAAGQSGFFDRLVLPSVTQLAFVVAAHMAWNEQYMPFVSKNENELTFIRTSTKVTENVVVGFAWIPGKSLYFDAFCIDEQSSRLVTPDAFIL